VFDGYSSSRYRPEQAQRVERGTALSFRNLGARRGCVVCIISRQLYSREDPVPILQEAGWTPGPVWTCAKNLASTGIFWGGIRSPDRPAPSQSLYRLSYPGPWNIHKQVYNFLHLIVHLIIRPPPSLPPTRYSFSTPKSTFLPLFIFFIFHFNPALI
jgi:hypothetical protein